MNLNWCRLLNLFSLCLVDCKLSGVMTASIAVFVWNTQGPKTRLVLLYITEIKIRENKPEPCTAWQDFQEHCKELGAQTLPLVGIKCRELMRSSSHWEQEQSWLCRMSLMPWTEDSWDLWFHSRGWAGTDPALAPFPCSGAPVRVHGKGERGEFIKSWEECTKSHLSCLLTEAAKIRQNLWEMGFERPILTMRWCLMRAMCGADFGVIKKKTSNALIEIWRLKVKSSVASLPYCQTGIYVAYV